MDGATGSSPLARGTQRRGPRSRRGARFIPARAGNTRARGPGLRRRPVHPRSRGEHPVAPIAFDPGSGSSPLARGTLREALARPRPARFIPARAGNTAASTPPRPSTSVHPRSRGEHKPASRGLLPQPGSSPLARGTPIEVDPVLGALRFIPARAGNTWAFATSLSPRVVHPRSRGEHDPVSRGLSSLAGSSPLARGTPRPARPRHRGRRFIPARAGNTRLIVERVAMAAVHPRSRGEHPASATTSLAGAGSSPLARGTRRGRPRRHPPTRFIPARAGNTWPGSGRATSSTVHPRSRGEHENRPFAEQYSSGSSPLARGTRPARGWRRR